MESMGCAPTCEKQRHTQSQRYTGWHDSFIHREEKYLSVRMMNLSQQPQHIHKETQLATCKPVLSVVQTAVELVLTNGPQDLGQTELIKHISRE